MGLHIQLSWQDPASGRSQQPVLAPPVALGREFALMPGMVDGQRVSRAVIAHPRVAEYHALITEQDGQLQITDQSGGGIQLNGAKVTVGRLQSGDRLQLGPITLQVRFTATAATQDAGAAAGVEGGSPGIGDMGLEPGCDRQVGFLFKRRCGRTDPTGCPYCRGGQVNPDYDPFGTDHTYYSGYGYYGQHHWGHGYYADRHHYTYDSHTRQLDFNDSDAASFEEEADRDYENRLDAS